MKTVATIHTVNGLLMNVLPAAASNSNQATAAAATEDANPSTTGWWELQHLKRGFSVSGRAFEDLTSPGGGVPPRNDDDKKEDSTASACPAHL